VKLAVAAAAAALVATALVASSASAAPVDARSKKSFNVTGEFATWQTVRSGNAQGIGDLTVATGPVSGSVGSGTLTTVVRVIAPGDKKDADLRDTQSQIQLKDGQIFAQAVNEDPKGKRPQTLHIMPVTGGTGAYAGARGTLTLIPQGKSGKYLMMYDVFTEKSLPRASMGFGAPVTTAAGTGVGSVTLARAVQGARSYISVATNLGSVKGTARQSIDLQVFDGDSTIFARTIATGRGKNQTYAVLGGTGSYAGARGELVLSANGRSMTVRVVTPRGKSESLDWVNRSKRTVNVASATDAAVYASGAASPAKGSRPKGDFYSSALTYPEVDGVVPVVAMVEQGFTNGTLVMSGMHLGSTAPRIAITGGTGEYGGAAGSVAANAARPAQVRMSGSFWR
jgi:hypothetical protein